MKQLAFAWVLVIAAAGSASAGPAKWCTKTNNQDTMSELSGSDPRSVLVALAKASCSTDAHVDAQRADIDSAREQWGKKYGLVDADWNDVLAHDDSRGYEFLYKHDYSANTLAGLSPVEQYQAFVNQFQNQGGDQIFGETLYLADAFGSKLTETGRLAVVDYCLSDKFETDTDQHFALWAICKDDFEKLDLRKVYEELRADTTRDPSARMEIRYHSYDVPARLAKVNDKKARFLKKDPEYKRVDDAAAAGRADWTKAFGGKTELLALVQAMESASYFHSRKLYDGCEATTEPALAKAVSTIPAKAFLTAHDTRDDPFGGFGHKAAPVLANSPEVYLAGVAYALCRPKSATGAFLEAVFGDLPGYRGPRTAAFSAIAGLELKFDDTTKKGLEMPTSKGRAIGRGAGTIGSAGGVVKSLKPVKGKRGNMAGKDLIEVTLEKTLIKQTDCVKEHRGNHIARVDGNGRVEYELLCDKFAVVTHDHTWSNFTINPDHAKRLKPGNVFSATFGNEGGDVLAVWKNKDATVPSMVLGGTVK